MKCDTCQMAVKAQQQWSPPRWRGKPYSLGPWLQIASTLLLTFHMDWKRALSCSDQKARSFQQGSLGMGPQTFCLPFSILFFGHLPAFYMLSFPFLPTSRDVFFSGHLTRERSAISGRGLLFQVFSSGVSPFSCAGFLCDLIGGLPPKCGENCPISGRRKMHMIRNTPNTAKNSMTGSGRPSPEPLLKKRGVPSRTGGERILEMLWKPQMP